MTAAEDIKHASIGFDLVFSNDIDAARTHLSSGDSPFHLMGLGCVTFLQAALGMETGIMAEASRLLTSAETKAKKEIKVSKSSAQARRFASGLHYEVLQADAILLLGLTQALSESYTGYLQCMYSLNSAHTKFTKIYKTAFPDGVDSFATPSSTPVPSRKPSLLNQSSDTASSSSSSISSASGRSGLFGRWGASTPKSPSTPVPVEPDGPVEELIISGAAFGYGLFNLVLSLLPTKVKGVVGFFGYASDRQLALRALAVAATKDDVHSVFAGLTLMSYHGAVLLLSGYQADEPHILKQYKAIVNKLGDRYPSGSLWILNRAKIMRYSFDPDGAISVLQAGLKRERPQSFVQADALLVFELAFLLLAQRRFQESADMFMKMTELNSWSHATYTFMAAGCYVSLGNVAKAQALFDTLPALLDKRKLGGRDLPTEVFIRKKMAFYKQKETRRGGSETNYVKSIRISPAEELGLFWNNHGRITTASAEAHLTDWLSLSPPVTIGTPYASRAVQPKSEGAGLPDLDTPDEFALRSLLLGVVHRSLSCFSESHAFLVDATKQPVEGKWTTAVAFFELAVLQLKEAEASDKEVASDHSKGLWKAALKEASQYLDKALEVSNTDLSTRLDSRISLLRDEITLKQDRVARKD